MILVDKGNRIMSANVFPVNRMYDVVENSVMFISHFPFDY